MKRFATSFGILWVWILILVPGCSQPIDLVWFNNTHQDVVIYHGLRQTAEHMRMQRAQKMKFYPRQSPFRLSIGQKTWVYDDIPVSYQLASRGRNPTFKIQIEPDGRIFYMDPEASSVTTNLPPQPAGFPRTPRMSID